MMTEITPYRVDNLLLLVGANPLPNYVAALLLTQEQSTVYLLHTSNTLQVAERLCGQIKAKCPHLTLIPWEIHKSDPQRIAQRLESLKREVGPNANVGLNYTGGSKPMAVQAYHTLHAAYPRGVFSYLDADTLSLVIEAPGKPTQQIFVGQSVQVDFKTLFALHGYELTVQRSCAVPPVLRQALVEVHSTKAGFDQWRVWLQTLGQPNPQLPTVATYPALAPVVDAFSALCAGAPTPQLVATALQCKHGRLTSCAKMLIADWLEEYVYETMSGLRDELALHQVGMGLEPKPDDPKRTRKMELDVAAMLGYQLFAISCMVTEKSQPATDHLMETYVRARQLGGDEARFALVCCYDQPRALQDKVSEAWDTEEKIRVFGREHLLDLPRHFRDWIATASLIH
jgi:hypothetical protein